MKNSWAVRDATDEVLELSAQLGVKNIVVYGGPGLDVQIGSTNALDNHRNTFDDYVAIRKRMESYGLNLVACEGGFLANPKYHDLVFGGLIGTLLLMTLLPKLQIWAALGFLYSDTTGCPLLCGDQNR